MSENVDRDSVASHCSSASWGWCNVEPQKWDFEKMRETIKEFESSLAERGYPDKYTCTQDVWDKLKETTRRTHSQGIGKTELDRVSGITVKVFGTTMDCINYITAEKIAGRMVQLLQ